MPPGKRNDGMPHKPNGNKPGSLPWSKKPKGERAAMRGPLLPQVDDSNWRVKMRAEQVKFDDRAKGRFLEAILRHGKRALAAQAAQVTMQTVNNHVRADPEFAELYDQALQERADRVTHQLEEEALEGYQEPIYSKDGDLVGHKQMYETPIRLAILRRYDPEYKDRTETTVHGTVGVLIAPAQMSPQAWIAEQEARNATRVDPSAIPLEPLTTPQSSPDGPPT